MQAYETFATVQPDGQLALAGLPFPPGTAVDVMITPKRASAADFALRWRDVTRQLRSTAAAQRDVAGIQAEINSHRAGR